MEIEVFEGKRTAALTKVWRPITLGGMVSREEIPLSALDDLMKYLEFGLSVRYGGGEEGHWYRKVCVRDFRD